MWGAKGLGVLFASFHSNAVPFYVMIIMVFLFGDIWNRPHLSLRDRQLITLAANIALARPHGTHSHYRSAHHIGITHEEICEIMIHVGMYGGWPCIAHATSQYLEVLEERGDPMAKSNPKRDEIKEE